MITADAISHNAQSTTNIPKNRHSLQGAEPSVFADIYREEINIVTWKRSLSESLRLSASELVVSNPMSVSYTHLTLPTTERV